MVAWVLRLVGAALLFGPAVTAYVVLPAGVLDAWPAFGVALLPAAATLVAVLAFHSWRPGLEQPLDTTADRWLRDEVVRLGRVGVKVAVMSGKNRDSFYHPASRTIVLADDVAGQSTARAHAIAAHELGHALFHLDRPLLSRVLLVARTRAMGMFHAGGGLLIGALVVGAGELALVAVALVAAGMVLQALVMADEVFASALARRMLREHLGAPEQARAATGGLTRALATYRLRLASTAVGVGLAAWLAWGREGRLIADGAPLAGWEVDAAGVVAAVTLAGAVVAVGSALRPLRGLTGALTSLTSALAVLWAPLLTALVVDQAAAPAWAVALAAVVAWSLLSAPLVMALGAAAAALGRDLVDVTQPLTSGPVRGLRRVGVAALAEHEEADGVLARLAGTVTYLWSAPLAWWWLAS